MKIKLILFVLIAIIFSACEDNSYVRTDFKLQCKNNNILITVWQKTYASKSEDIKKPENIKLKNTLWLDENGKSIKCIK